MTLEFSNLGIKLWKKKKKIRKLQILQKA